MLSRHEARRDHEVMECPLVATQASWLLWHSHTNSPSLVIKGNAAFSATIASGKAGILYQAIK